MATKPAARTEVWMTDFGGGRGHEQAGARPSLVISHDVFNQGAADLVVVISITSKAKGVRTHVEIKPPEGGLSVVSFAKCEDIRSISKDRLQRRMGAVTPATMVKVEAVLRALLVL
ncbi:MAG: type II toxin-antitoxin system PemK/MazF family toxin [Gemmataceae bacterium]|nr:type II toxin-antitoxin system PemK/MazF family toxin [Gemmataceae bacterium]MCI0737440.1 type II toxin-antitoxin system PemK/MazF family toxin [Gemmataceae bacterium]